MGLRPRATKGSIHREFELKKRALDNAILSNLLFLGELCVNHARSVNTYRDQTGNLRNSIGYVIVHNGTIVKNAFSKTAPGGAQGVLTGRELAVKLAGEVGQGWALIVVAGMNYALSVESRGLDVLTTSEHLAKTELPKLLTDLKIDIKNLASLQ